MKKGIDLWKKMTWGRWKKTNNSAFSGTHTYIKPTLVSFFLLFYFVHLPLTVILSLGPKLAQMAKKTTDEIVLFCVPRAHWVQMLVFICFGEIHCKFRFGREYMREKCVGWFFRGKRFQAVSARNCFTEFAAVSRHKFCPATARKEAKIETSDEVFEWDTSCNFEATAGGNNCKSIDPVIKVASNASDAKCSPLCSKMFPRTCFCRWRE